MKTYHIYSSYTELPESWKLITEHDIFLQTKYFSALEKSSPKNIQFFYVGIFNNDELVGVAVIQRVQLYLKDMFRQTKVSCIKTFVQDLVSKVLKGNILVVGNLTHTGQHGVFYESNKITQSEYLEVVFKALNELKTAIIQSYYENKAKRSDKPLPSRIKDGDWNDVLYLTALQFQNDDKPDRYYEWGRSIKGFHDKPEREAQMINSWKNVKNPPKKDDV